MRTIHKQQLSKNAFAAFPRMLLVQLMSSGTWYISGGASAGDKERLATIKKDLANNSSASVFLQGNSSQHFAQPVPDYSARGDFHNRSFFIYRGTIPVAEVQHCLPALLTLVHASATAMHVSLLDQHGNPHL